jgi:hypothetical protein
VLIATGVPTSMTLPAMPGALSADGGYIAYARNYAPPHPGGAFLRERTSGATVQVDIDLNGQPLNAPIFDVALSADASTMAFATWTAGLVIGDNNGVRDVFVRDNQLAGASYCTTSTTSNGCSPAIDASGAPSASATSGYVVQVQQVEGQRAGLILYGTTAAAVPWASGSSSVLCVGAPRQRTTLSFSGGTHASCDGALAIDLLAWIAAHPGALGTPLQAGQSLYLQGYFRDPPAPKGSNLSGGWAVTLGP